MKNIVLCSFIFILASCSGAQEVRKADPGDVPQTAPAATENAQAKTAPEPPAAPRYRPVTEDITPLKKRILSISVRNAALRDVAKIIADSANLNLVMEKGVNTEVPVTITLNYVTVQDALEIIFSSVDYFYEIRKNLLVIKAQDTVIFEFGHPSVINNYSISLGGDILGGATGGTAAAGGASALTGGATSNLKGDVSVDGRMDTKAQNLWDEISDALGAILKADETGRTVKPYFSVNRITGTIVVTASKNALRRVVELLTRVRESLNRQVMIEARIVEIQLSEGLQYGIDWNFLDDWKGVGTMNVGAAGFTNVVDATGPSFQFGVTGINFTSLLKALQTKGNVNVLSNPRVSVMNGQTSLLSVGRNVNFISRVQTTTTAATTGSIPQTTFSVETSSILSGIIIGIVPYINPEGMVSMTITPIVSDLVTLQDKSLGTVGTNSITISLPTVDLREMSTTVRIADGEMVVIGGLINKKEFEQDQGIPVLSKIPILGALFKNREKTEERTELVVMIKPVVLK